MNYSIFTEPNLFMEIFESIDKIEIILERNKRQALLYLNNYYCDFEITIKDIKELMPDKDLDSVIFIR